VAHEISEFCTTRIRFTVESKQVEESKTKNVNVYELIKSFSDLDSYSTREQTFSALGTSNFELGLQGIEISPLPNNIIGSGTREYIPHKSRQFLQIFFLSFPTPFTAPKSVPLMWSYFSKRLGSRTI